MWLFRNKVWFLILCALFVCDFPGTFESEVESSTFFEPTGQWCSHTEDSLESWIFAFQNDGVQVMKTSRDAHEETSWNSFFHKNEIAQQWTEVADSKDKGSMSITVEKLNSSLLMISLKKYLLHVPEDKSGKKLGSEISEMHISVSPCEKKIEEKEENFLVVVFFSFIGCSLIWLIYRSHNIEYVPKGRKSVPGITGLPFFGCLFQYSFDPTGFLENARKRYGDIFSFNMAGRSIVLLTSHDAIRTYYRADEEVLNADDAFRDFGFRQIPALQQVPELNKYLLRIKLQSNMSFFITTFSSYIQEYMKECLPPTGQPQEIFSAIKKMSQHATISTFIGKEVLDTQFMQEMFKFQELNRKAIAKTIILPKLFTKNAWKEVAQQRQKLIDELIPIVEKKFGDAVKNPEAFQQNPNSPHYIQFIIQYHLDNNLQDLLSSQTLSQYLLGLIFGAFSNPAITASQAMLFLLEKPEHISKIDQEAASILGENYGKPSSYTMERLQSLPFLDSCVRETLRLITHPMGTMRKARQPIEFKIEETGEIFYVPQGKFVGIPHNLVTTDGTFYSNPKEYDPYRFERQEHRNAPFCFIPFSGGRHACPGKNFALLAIKSILLQWIHNYSSTLQTNPLPELNFRGGGNVATRKGLCMVQFHPKKN